MRPVNLIPPEERRRGSGGAASARAGRLPTLVVGLLAALLVGVTMVVLTGNTIADRQSEVASLERKQAEAEARSQALSSFVSVEQVRLAREQTLVSLAESRFDWERVMRELSLVLPGRIELESLRGTVAPEVQVGGDSVALRSTISGPALELLGCGHSHRDVARLLAALEDIDGVTRVGAETSERSNNEVGAEAVGCAAGSFVSFAVVAGFDAVVVPAAAGVTPAMTVSAAAPGATQIAASQPDGVIETASADRRQDLTSSEGRIARAKELIP